MPNKSDAVSKIKSHCIRRIRRALAPSFENWKVGEPSNSSEPNAPGALFDGDFDDLSTKHQELFIGPDRVICDSGTIGRWCLECRFGDVEEEREFE